jgi:hypothetical protein
MIVPWRGQSKLAASPFSLPFSLCEHFEFGDGAIEDVVDFAAGCISGFARHGCMIVL